MVELMIAILLGAFLLGGVLQLFVSNKSTFNNMEGISQIQDNARPGIERMKERVRMSGYMGCTNLGIQTPNNVTGPTSPVLFDATTQITGTDNDANAGNTIVDGTDTVTVMSASLADTTMNVDMAAPTDDVVLSRNPANFQTNSLILITDCENVDIFRATALAEDPVTGITTIEHDQTGTLNSTTQLSKPYLVNNTMVMALRNVTYSVQPTNPLRLDESGNPVMALFETPAGGAAIEIMTGVEDMQITYGEDTTNNGQVDVYRDAATVGNMANVRSIRINLLLATDRDIGPDPRPYVDLAGATQNTDRRMRRPFTTTISLRNRSS
jgi:type IV pilus assembly protein PilW